MMKYSLKEKIIRKKTPVKGYFKNNGSVISPHMRCLTTVSSPSLKSNFSKMIFKNNYYNNDTGKNPVQIVVLDRFRLSFFLLGCN